MLELLRMAFVQRAFLVGALIAVICACVGVVIVLRRMSNMGDTLAHGALAGITLGLVLGVNPILGGIAASILAVCAVEGLRRALPKYAEMSTAIVLSAGIGLTAVFSGFITQGVSLTSFLFGSIVSITNFELYLCIGLCAAVAAGSLLLYKELFFISFDEEAARLAGIPSGRINFVFMLLTAVTVSVASRTVGSLIVSSLLVLPVACAMAVAKSYKRTVIYSVGFALFFTVGGLLIAIAADLKSGGSIVLLGVATLIVLLLVKRFRKA